MMEQGHTRFSPDTGFGLVRQHEARTESHTLDDVASMINGSTPTTMRNNGIVMPQWAFKKWSLHDPFKPIPNMRRMHMIRLEMRSNGHVHTLTREGYMDYWKDHGTLLKQGYVWPDGVDDKDLVEDQPLCVLSDSRICHIREHVMQAVRADKKAFWDAIAPQAVADRVAAEKAQQRQVTRTTPTTNDNVITENTSVEEVNVETSDDMHVQSDVVPDSAISPQIVESSTTDIVDCDDEVVPLTRKRNRSSSKKSSHKKSKKKKKTKKTKKSHTVIQNDDVCQTPPTTFVVDNDPLVVQEVAEPSTETEKKRGDLLRCRRSFLIPQT